MSGSSEKGCPLLCSHEEVSLNNGCEVRDYIQYVVETLLNSVPTQYTPAESPCSYEEFFYRHKRIAFAEHVCCLYYRPSCIEYVTNRLVVQRAARESRGLGSKPSSLIASWFHDIIFGRVEPCDCGAKDEDGKVIEHFSPGHSACLRGGKQEGEKSCPLLCSALMKRCHSTMVVKCTISTHPSSSSWSTACSLNIRPVRPQNPSIPSSKTPPIGSTTSFLGA